MVRNFSSKPGSDCLTSVPALCPLTNDPFASRDRHLTKNHTNAAHLTVIVENCSEHESVILDARKPSKRQGQCEVPGSAPLHQTIRVGDQQPQRGLRVVKAFMDPSTRLGNERRYVVGPGLG